MDIGLFEVVIGALLGLFLLFIILCVVLIQTTSPYPVVTRSKNEKYFFDCDSGKKIEFPSLEDPWSVHLSVIVPAYDEAKRLPPMLDECLEYLESRRKKNEKFKYEVIIVSDGSKDKTVDVALKYSKKYGSNIVRVLSLETNRGKGGAVRLGMQSARGATLLFADADGATKFSDLVKLEDDLQRLIKCDFEKDGDKANVSVGLVCGSRAHLEEEAMAQRSFFRNLLGIGYRSLVKLFAVKDVRDTQCGFKLLTRRTARVCFASLHVERWAFDVELLYIAEKLKIPIGEIAVNWTEIEGSKIIPVFSWLQMARDLFFIWLRYRIGAWKISEKSS